MTDSPTGNMSAVTILQYDYYFLAFRGHQSAATKILQVVALDENSARFIEFIFYTNDQSSDYKYIPFVEPYD